MRLLLFVVLRDDDRHAVFSYQNVLVPGGSDDGDETEVSAPEAFVAVIDLKELFACITNRSLISGVPSFKLTGAVV